MSMVDLARLLTEVERRPRRAFDLEGFWAMHEESSGSIGEGLCHRYLVARPGRSGREAARSPPQPKPCDPGRAGHPVRCARRRATLVDVGEVVRLRDE